MAGLRGHIGERGVVTPFCRLTSRSVRPAEVTQRKLWAVPPELLMPSEADRNNTTDSACVHPLAALEKAKFKAENLFNTHQYEGAFFGNPASFEENPARIAVGGGLSVADCGRAWSPGCGDQLE